MMYLKKALWSEGIESEKGDSEVDVSELVNSLHDQRIYREITLSLQSGLRDARAEFSFLRLRALRSILNFLRSLSHSHSTIHIFNVTQSIPHFQVVPVLFQHSLKQTPHHYNDNDDTNSNVGDMSHIFGVEPIKLTTPPTDAEVALALRVLEGCCLLNPNSAALAHQHNAIQVLMNILSNRRVLEQTACLDALISLMVDSSSNQIDFEECNGIMEVSDLIRDKQVDENLRLKCGEFLLLLIGHVNGRDKPPLATIHDDIRRLLGEKSASLIWAASQFGSTLDPEQRLTALQIQARRVLESLDLY
ncbi:hypothetical protein Lal_00035041 [Lupinus albus]|uniref:Putative Cell division protein Cdc14 n=1 Tax=Lupinus albus TaxID=3870 RepID=A0A6A4QT15_LUPAL|nr:putative Cell division protein Cdc14 [Lupinus albus]KAF1897338.1 hypothetical protein Lal_00035041 [Lupinus albus]